MILDAEFIAERYIAIWNEQDAALRRQFIAETFTDDATYLDPIMQAKGHDGIDAMIARAREQFPGHHFAVEGTPDGHNSCIRFAWSLAPEGGDPIARGTDLAVVAPDGRLERVTGFLDLAPGGAHERAADGQWSVDDFARFWASPDPRLIGEGIAPDAVAYWPGLQTPIRGRDNYARPLRALLDRVPDFRMEVAEHASSGNSVFIRWIARGSEGGRPFEFTGVDIVRHKDGLVVGNRIFCDHPLVKEIVMG